MRKTIGSRQAKEVIKMNGGIRIGAVVIAKENGRYIASDRGRDIIKTKRLNTMLDWAVGEGLVGETRFRLTVHQRDILRQRIWEYIGWVIAGGLSLSLSIIFAIAWTLGIGC